MKYAFILQNSSAFSMMNWIKFFESLTSEEKENTKFIFICKENSKNPMDKLSEEEKEYFSEVINLPANVTLEEIKLRIESTLKENFKSGDSSALATMHEFEMSNVGQLRDAFRERFNMLGVGEEGLNRFRDKIVMKKTMEAAGVNIPKYFQFDPERYQRNKEDYLARVEQTLGFPMFIKPTNMGGSMDTALINDSDALEIWCEKYQEATSSYEIDEFIDGPLFHCDLVMENSEVKASVVSEYLHPNGISFLEGAVLASKPLEPDHPDYEAIKEFANTAMTAFPDKPNCIAHMEIFKRGKEYIFLEVAARPPGAAVFQVYRERMGVEIIQAHFKLGLELNVDEVITMLKHPDEWNNQYAFMFQIVVPGQSVMVTSTKMPEFQSSLCHYLTWKFNQGDIITPDPHRSVMSVGFSTVVTNSDRFALEADFSNLDQQKVMTFEAIKVEKKKSNAQLIAQIGLLPQAKDVEIDESNEHSLSASPIS